MSGKCYGFVWVGQPFSSCDNCGQPYWEHTHEEVRHPGGGPFGRLLRRIISADHKEANPQEMGDAMNSQPMTDEEILIACEWSDYRKSYGLPEPCLTVAHKAFKDGWEAAKGKSHAPGALL